MAYIIVLNPIILSGSEDVTGNSLSFAAVSAVTALVAAVMTMLFGLVTRLPFAFAAGSASTRSWPPRWSASSPGRRPWGWW